MDLLERLAKHRVCLVGLVKSQETGTSESVEDPLPLFLKIVKRFRFFSFLLSLFIVGPNLVLVILE